MRRAIVFCLLIVSGCHLEGLRRGAINAQWLIDKLSEPGARLLRQPGQWSVQRLRRRVPAVPVVGAEKGVRAMRGVSVLLLLLSGCAAGDMAAGVAVVDHVTEEVTHEHAHNCMCVPDGRTKQWYWCDENGKRDGNGEYACCFYCEKNCGRLRDTAKPPVPVPMPPQCDAETHCKSKESCVVGDHTCCAACHQACFWEER